MRQPSSNSDQIAMRMPLRKNVVARLYIIPMNTTARKGQSVLRRCKDLLVAFVAVMVFLGCMTAVNGLQRICVAVSKNA